MASRDNKIREWLLNNRVTDEKLINEILNTPAINNYQVGKWMLSKDRKNNKYFRCYDFSDRRVVSYNNYSTAMFDVDNVLSINFKRKYQLIDDIDEYLTAKRIKKHLNELLNVSSRSICTINKRNCKDGIYIDFEYYCKLERIPSETMMKTITSVINSNVKFSDDLDSIFL